MALRKPEMPGAADHLAAKLDAAVVESMASSLIGEPAWSRMFCFCGDGMYRVSVRCNRSFLDVSVRSVTAEGEEDDGISIMFCASTGHRSRVQVDHSARELDAGVFSAVRFGTGIAETAAASWERSRRGLESRPADSP
jgi:hypothetical protein